MPRNVRPALWHRLVLTFAVAVTALALSFDATTRWPAVLGLAIYDAQVRMLRALRPTQQESVVVVGIDQATLDAIELPMTLWHRELGRTLEAIASARPRLVGLDLVLPERSFDNVVAGLDRSLLRGIVFAREAGGIVLALQPDAAGHLRAIHAPFIAAAGVGGVGAAVYPVDPDGVVRRFDHATSTFITTMANKLVRPNTSGLIDYSRGAPFAYVPMLSVLRWQETGANTELARQFAGKTVLIGSVLPLVDRRAQPVSLAAWESPVLEPPGVLIHAQAMRSVLANGFIWDAGWVVAASLALLLALVGASGHVTRRWVALATALVLGFIGATIALDRGVFVSLGPALLAGLLAAGARSAFDGWRYLADRNRVARTFAGYVSPQVFDAVLEGSVVTRGHARLAFLFADVRGFTTLTESTPAGEVLDWLNAYYTAVTPLLHAHGATIDSFRGDGVTALFGAPKPMENACSSALRAARAMLQAVDTLNTQPRSASVPAITIGIGLAFGEAVFGDLGSPDRRDFTAIGDDVNVAARLQDLTKVLACPILLTDAMRAALPAAEQATLIDFGEQALKGHSPVRVWGSSHA